MATNWKQAQAAAARREEILEAIGQFIDDHGMAPTRAELCALTGVSAPTLQTHIKALVEDGRLRVGKGHRALELRL